MGPERHAAGGRVEGERPAELLLQARDQRVAARQVDAAHPPHVALHLAVLEQLGDGALEHVIALAIDD